MSGWGPELAGFLEPGDIVLNFAKGGATTASFAAEGLWQDLLKELEPQNFVLIQFGHNDQKHPQLLAPEGGYTERLAEFVADVRDRGGVPVLCTSVERCWFSNARLSPSHGGYPAAVRALAAREQVPVIDLTVFSSWLYESLGETAALALFTEPISVSAAPGKLHPTLPAPWQRSVDGMRGSHPSGRTCDGLRQRTAVPG
jgi:lysophospholipase L1-like esterase